MMPKENQKNIPNWKVITKRGEELGSQIGVGFNHHSGGGMTILMDAQPILGSDSQIELVIFPIKSNE